VLLVGISWTFGALAVSASGSDFTRLIVPETPHRSVYALLEDSDGFLWIGTQDGLARYDGYEMPAWRHDPGDPESLSSSSVRALAEGPQGRIWVGTENGLNTIDRRTMAISRIATPGHPVGHGAWFNCSFVDSEGLLWFGTDDGLLRIDPKDGAAPSPRGETVGLRALDGRSVDAIQQHADGSVWVVTNDVDTLTLVRLDGRGNLRESFAFPADEPRAHGMLIDSTGRLWVHPHLFFDTDSMPDHAPDPEPEGVCIEMRAAVERSDGVLWFACDDGLHRIDPGSNVVERQLIVATDGTWLENFGRALIEDRSGTLWVGTEGGLFRHDPHAKPFEHIGRNPNDRHSLSADAISALAETPDGDIWVATYGGGLNRVDLDTGFVRRFCTDPDDPSRCTSTVLWHLHTSLDGTLWIAGDELWSLDPADEQLTLHSPPGLIEEYAVFIVEGGTGVLWIGSINGLLLRYSVASGTFDTFELDLEPTNPDNDNRLDSLLLEDDRLWIGLGESLGVFDTSTNEFESIPLLSHDGIKLGSLGTWAIHRSRDGELWLGTAAGLLRLLDDNSFEFLTTRDGLPGSAVYSILETPDAAMWLGTNQGLVRLQPSASSGDRIRTFTRADGIGNTEFNRHAALRRDDGSMVFGGMDGLTLVHTDHVGKNPHPPPIRITRIEIAGRDGVRTATVGADDELILGPEDSWIGFEFAALSFTAPELNRYAYWLEGFDDEWVESGTRRTTQYTNLPAGRYRFHVRGSNNDGVWNDEGAVLDIVVLPNLWQTWWFRPMLIILATAGVWIGLAYRQRKQREIKRMRMRIAGDLHDDLSSDLSGIAVLADIVRQADDLGDEERGDLGRIRDVSLQMADGLRDIVWYIDPDHDSLTATVRRMRSVASTLLRGLENRFHTSLPDRNLPLPVNTRRNLFLIFKEAVHNIVRHAEASRVEITISVSGHRFELSIADDGKGFDPRSVRTGHGLGSMQRRADEMNGTLRINSTPGRGTLLELTVDMAGSRDGRWSASGSKVNPARIKDRED
jgi:ligand-binding sensor domain-containing protein